MEICKGANTDPLCRFRLWFHKMLFLVAQPALKVPVPSGCQSLFLSLYFSYPSAALSYSFRIQVKNKPNTFIFSRDDFTDLFCSAAP